MAHNLNTIVIDEHDETPSRTLSQPRRSLRWRPRDLEFEGVFLDSPRESSETKSSKKRSSDMSDLRSSDHALKKLRSMLDLEMATVEETILKLQEELLFERREHQKTQAELSKQRDALHCKICFEQPDHWVTLSCGHMVCLSCKGTIVTPKKCPLCRASVKGYLECYPFA